MMQVAKGWPWLPDGESDPVMLSAGSQYQHQKLMAALKYVKNSRTAIDVGAHCGLWSLQLGQFFERVECFEPLPMHIECWKKNVGWKRLCVLHEVALGAKPFSCGIKVVDGLSGRSYVTTGNDYRVEKLDDFKFSDVDFIKIDVEGYELFVIQGAMDTINRCRPVMVVEQKPGHAERYGLSTTAAVMFLEDEGYEVKAEIAGDFVMVPREA